MATTAEFPALPADRPVDGDAGEQKPYLVIGGGPAGLTAGYLLAKAGKRVIVFEADDQVGGIAKTVVDPHGYRFDLGGHRFFTKKDRKSTRLNSSHANISYAVFCLKKTSIQCLPSSRA